MKGAIKKAEELTGEMKHSFIPGQFSNPANPAIHKSTTDPEIWEDTDGHVDIVVAGFIPEILDTNIYDEVIKVKNEDAYQASRDTAETEGLLIGISSGAALWAETQLAIRPENKDKNIVVILLYSIFDAAFTLSNSSCIFCPGSLDNKETRTIHIQEIRKAGSNS